MASNGLKYRRRTGLLGIELILLLNRSATFSRYYWYEYKYNYMVLYTER